MPLTDNSNIPWQILKQKLEGEVLRDELSRKMYATDASVYREIPAAVVYPKHKNDLQTLVNFANANQMGLTARSAGTSLAGQCVTNGIVVDVSRHMNRILEINEKEKWARVQPGVIRDELNTALRDHKLFFGPNTSTANRATIGGMAGNNSSGSYSLVYGTTRDHLIEIETVVSNGETIKFKSLNTKHFNQKCNQADFEGKLYQNISNLLSSEENRVLINARFPKSSIHRRNTGYALDQLALSNIYNDKGADFNFASLLCGSEGTLCFFSELKINLVERPPDEVLMIAAHFENIHQALESVTTILNFNPRAVELMDDIILDCTKDIPAQQENRFFVSGNPEAILIIELGGGSVDENKKTAEALIKSLKAQKKGFHFPMIEGSDIPKAWELREAGLGALSNLKGDAKPVAVVEDTAVATEDLAAYISAFSSLMQQFGQKSVYYAHAGAGELHLRPILNLKKAEDVRKFREIGKAVADLVKTYQGSLSGEHGDGRVRSEFIRDIYGTEIVQMFEAVKDCWDPENIFNPGKITRPVAMDQSLRYEADKETRNIDTKLDFAHAGGMLRATEKCNGSGDCRKLAISGGVMCPSYMATRNEKHSTRARANALREYLTNSPKENPFNHAELKDVLDLCLSCKGCTSECPSGVDMAAMKAEFLYQYNRENGAPFRDKLFASVYKTNKLSSYAPNVSNFLLNKTPLTSVFKKLTGISPDRSIPEVKGDLLKWWQKNSDRLLPENPIAEVYFFADEFTRFNDFEDGKKAILLLVELGVSVEIPVHTESGRAMISKGFLDESKKVAAQNINLLSPLVRKNKPLVGLEPSAILSFRDEYPKLLQGDQKQKAEVLKTQTFLFDEYITNLIQSHPEVDFSKKFQGLSENQHIHIHGHCHQKAFSKVDITANLIKKLLSTENVNIIPSGCCGMAGTFGYEKEHYQLSKDIAELTLIPYIKKLNHTHTFIAPGTSCRHQIRDFSGRESFHPAAFLYDCLVEKVFKL